MFLLWRPGKACGGRSRLVRHMGSIDNHGKNQMGHLECLVACMRSFCARPEASGAPGWNQSIHGCHRRDPIRPFCGALPAYPVPTGWLVDHWRRFQRAGNPHACPPLPTALGQGPHRSIAYATPFKIEGQRPGKGASGLVRRSGIEG